jgi:isoleucyl-tRNA synthetase
MLVSASGEDNHRFSTQMVAESERKFLLTLWNTYSFFTTYANIDHFVPQLPCHCEERDSSLVIASEAKQSQDKLGTGSTISFSMLDNWIISELNRLIVEVTKVLDNYNPTSAARKIEAFVDNLSNWWVRRSRRRFWKSENDADKLAAYTTVYHCLVTLSQLLAPFIPFVAEELYQNLVRSALTQTLSLEGRGLGEGEKKQSQIKESVHLTNFPVADEAKIDDELNSDVELAMKIARLGRAARAKAGIKVRQPLGKMVVKVSSTREENALHRLAGEISEEVNVKEIVFASEAKQSPEQLTATCYNIASDAKYWVAINIELNPELVAEGISREIVRRLQTMRRAAKFDIADHIVTYYQAEERVKRVIADFAGYIKQETLSRELIDSFPPHGAYAEKHRISDSDVLLAVEKS